MKTILILGLVSFIGSLYSHAALITSPSDPALAGAKTLDLRNIPVGPFERLTIGPLTISSMCACEAMSIQRDYYSGEPYIANYPDPRYWWNSGMDFIFFDFAEPVRAVGFNWAASEPGWYIQHGVTEEGFPAEMHYLPASSGFFGISSNENIGGFIVRTDRNADWNYISFSNIMITAVPEPESYATLMGGFAAMVAVLRRRKAR